VISYIEIFGLKAGFVNTGLKGRMVWINPKNKKQYLADPESFGCHRVHDAIVMMFK
jgi:hypothetical protein